MSSSTPNQSDAPSSNRVDAPAQTWYTRVKPNLTFTSILELLISLIATAFMLYFALDIIESTLILALYALGGATVISRHFLIRFCIQTGNTFSYAFWMQHVCKEDIPSVRKCWQILMAILAIEGLFVGLCLIGLAPKNWAVDEIRRYGDFAAWMKGVITLGFGGESAVEW